MSSAGVGRVEDVRVAYVGGCARSGTTLLAQGLGSLPGALAIGEFKDLWWAAEVNYPCSCGSPLRACPVWSAALAAVHARHGVDASGYAGLHGLATSILRTRRASRIVRLRSRPRERWPEHIRRYVDVNTTLLRAALDVSGADVVVDSSKFPPGFLLHMLAPDADVRVVHIVRDPRAVANSERKSRKAGQEGAPQAHGSPWREEITCGNAALASAAYWGGMNLAVARYACHVSAYRRVRYEDLADRPHDVLRSLGRFTGLDGRIPGAAGEPIALDPGHVAVGNPCRFDGPTRSIRVDLSWREELPARDRLAVNAVTAMPRLVLHTPGIRSRVRGS
ncbi:MAG: sulfotransferase [Carbonactinosporaceae bacterium]